MKNNSSAPVVLFTANDSIYDSLNCDTYPIQRNALTCQSQKAAIYHPPCRTWGRLRQFSHSVPAEHLLAVWSIIRIRKFGGVLEHPAGSQLWKKMNLPLPGLQTDIYGGFSLSIDQNWFGHKCKKNTWLYVCGCTRLDIPRMPLNFNLIEYSITNSSKKSRLKVVSKKYRSSTPVELAKFLIEIINIINSKS